MKPIVAKATRNLPANARLVELDQPVSLVTLTTEAGRAFTCAAETIFALQHLSGAPVILPPIPPRAAPLNWWIKAVEDDDPRFWFICGAVVGGGRYPGPTLTIPAQFTLPHADRELAAGVSRFLCDLSATYPEINQRGLAKRFDFRHSDNETRIASRLIDFVLADVCCGFIDPPARTFNLDTLSQMRRAAQSGFMSGLLRSMRREEQGKVFRHRSAAALRAVHDTLFHNFGVPTTLYLNPMYGELMSHTRGSSDGHRLLLRDEHCGFVQRAGLAVDDAPGDPAMIHVREGIVCVRDAGKCAAVEIHCDAPQCVAGGFVLSSEYEVPAAALKLATAPELLA